MERTPTHQRMPVVALGLVVMAAAGTALAQSQEGVFSAEGVQIRSDARVYTLFATLNARGFDRESQRGPEPTEAPRYHPLRQRLREKLHLGPDVDKQADTFLRAHPESVVRYTRAALALEDGPRFATPEGVTLGSFDGLGKVLAAAWNASVGEMYDNDTTELRRMAKDMLPQVDALTADIRTRLHLGGSADEQFSLDSDANERLAVIVNPFDSHGAQLRHRAVPVHTVVLGPWISIADKGVLDPVAVEFARTLVGPEVNKVANLPEVAAVMQQAGPGAARFDDAADFLTEGLSRAVAEKALKRPLVLRTGMESEADMPLAAEFARVMDRFTQGSEPLSKALPGMVAELGSKSANPPPVPVASPSANPGAAPAAPAVAPSAVPPAQATSPKKSAKPKQ